MTINSSKIPFVVFHPLEKVIALGCIALLGCYICYVSLIAMTAARQVIAEMKKERFKYEIHIQKQLHYTFPITVPYRKAGSHDLGHIMHRNLPRVVASMWFILYSIAVSSILGGDVGFKASILMLFGGLYFYLEYISPYVESVIVSIEEDHTKTIIRNRRMVNLSENSIDDKEV